MKFWLAFRFLRGNLGRATFPLISVIIGTITLIMTLSLGDGVKEIINKDLSAIGKNRILIGGGSLNNKDLELVEKIPFVEYAIFPDKRKLVGNILFKGYSKKALNAINLPTLKEEEVVLDKNQFWNMKIGTEVELEIGLGKKKFIIKDLYQEESPFETAKMGNRVIISEETFDKIFGRSSYNSLIISFPQHEDGIKYIPMILKELNKYRFSYNQIKVLEIPNIYKKVERIKSFVGKGLFILSFISLIVGGIGILNLIAVAVKERSSYIGILRTFGMDKKSLIKVFLIEAAIVIILGTVIGIVFGIIISYFTGYILKIPPYFNFFKIIIIIIFTMSAGLLLGVVPAKRAGTLNIIEALKL